MALSKYQFDAPDADVILMTTEADSSTEFRVHRCLLSAASPFFSDMFSLPQGKTPREDVPTIPVPETAHVLDNILRFIYPIPDPIISSLDELTAVLAAAIKYDLVQAISAIRKILISSEFLKANPLQVYAVACRFDLDEEAKVASRHTLGIDLVEAPSIEALRHISAYDYHRLLKLHRYRSHAALELLNTAPENMKCMQCNGSAFTMDRKPGWWMEFERIARGRLEVRPSTEGLFEVEFLFMVARAAGCTRCPESVLDSWRFLKDLQRAIDALPATV
ncbi:hypothetical protein NLJ89_g7968 [Agrocybe chaxingu]|uniref:BTB domain-containing protein n=1 Tax=Agrocybe chaxingu TaxID=84603 RepID=A0A9W8JW96_9AGAR|nr:hypothetical protein NLJ89_g7968 [Agrocybe chaxingu]